MDTVLCVVCRKPLPEIRRSDMRYCGSDCRVRAFEIREHGGERPARAKRRRSRAALVEDARVTHLLGRVQELQRQLDEEHTRSARLEAADMELVQQLRHAEESRLSAARAAEEHRTAALSAQEAAQELRRQLDEEQARCTQLKAAKEKLGEQLRHVEEKNRSAARRADEHRTAAQSAQEEFVKVVAQLADLKRQRRTRPAEAGRNDAEDVTQKSSGNGHKKTRRQQISPLGSLPELITVRPRPAAQVAASGRESAFHSDSSKTAGKSSAPKVGTPTPRRPPSAPSQAPQRSSEEGWLGKIFTFGAGMAAGIVTGIESERKAHLDEARTRAMRRTSAALPAIPETVVAIPDDTGRAQQPLHAEPKRLAFLPSAKVEADWSASPSEGHAVKGDADHESVPRGDRPRRTIRSL